LRVDLRCTPWCKAGVVGTTLRGENGFWPIATYLHGLSAREVVEKNGHFFKYGTNSLSFRELKHEFATCFSQVEFVERVFLPYSNRPRALPKVPFGAVLYGLLLSRFLVAADDQKRFRLVDIPTFPNRGGR
jgi:hypothetical protein